MAFEWTTVRAADFIEFNPRLSLKKGVVATKVAMEKLQPFTKKIPTAEQAEFAGGSKFCNGDTIMARITPCLENGKTAFVDILADEEVAFGSTEFIVMRARAGVSDPQFIYYLATSPAFRNVAIKSMVGSSGRQRVQQGVLDELELTVPPLEEQQKIGAFLALMDEKIAINNKINDNFDVDTEHGIVDPNSLHGQYVNNYAGKTPDALYNDIVKALQSKKPKMVDQERPYGGQIKYKLGTIYDDKQGYLLLAYSKFDKDNRAYLKCDDIAQCYLNLWNEIDIIRGTKSIALPVLGAGGVVRFSKDYTPQQLIELILWSFRISGIRLSKNATLTIVVHESLVKDIDFLKLSCYSD